MKTNSQLAGTSSRSPESRSASVSASRCPSPRHADDLAAEAHLDVGRGVDPLDEVLRHRCPRATRPRTTSTTRLAKRARLSAACPAEFAAPTM